MIRAQRRFDFYLQDMQEALERIHDYTANITFEEFISNTMLRDAVIRNFEDTANFTRDVASDWIAR